MRTAHRVSFAREPADETFAVENRSDETAIRAPSNHVHGTHLARFRRQFVEQLHDCRLVRHRDDCAAEVLHMPQRGDALGETVRRHVHRHEHARAEPPHRSSSAFAKPGLRAESPDRQSIRVLSSHR